MPGLEYHSAPQALAADRCLLGNFSSGFIAALPGAIDAMGLPGGELGSAGSASAEIKTRIAIFGFAHGRFLCESIKSFSL